MRLALESSGIEHRSVVLITSSVYVPMYVPMYAGAITYMESSSPDARRLYMTDWQTCIQKRWGCIHIAYIRHADRGDLLPRRKIFLLTKCMYVCMYADTTLPRVRVARSGVRGRTHTPDGVFRRTITYMRQVRVVRVVRGVFRPRQGLEAAAGPRSRGGAL